MGCDDMISARDDLSDITTCIGAALKSSKQKCLLCFDTSFGPKELTTTGRSVVEHLYVSAPVPPVPGTILLRESDGTVAEKKTQGATARVRRNVAVDAVDWGQYPHPRYYAST